MGDVSFCERDEYVVHGDVERGCNITQFMLSEILYNITREVPSAPECQGTSCSAQCLEHLKVR